MAVDIGGLVGGALGGAIVTSVISPLVAQRVDRRELRAAALHSLAAVELARWADADWDEFRKAVVELRSAVLVAGANRELAERYLTLAQVARRASDDAMELHGDPESAGIPQPLAAVVRLASGALVDHLWHPWRTRLVLRFRLRRLDRARDSAKNELADLKTPKVQWALAAIQ